MTLGIRIAKAAVLLLLAAVVGAATAPVAGAATPSCGASCANFFSTFSATTSVPGFVVDDPTGSQAAGAPLTLFRTNNADPTRTSPSRRLSPCPTTSWQGSWLREWMTITGT
jgi:hypothetical protein